VSVTGDTKISVRLCGFDSSNSSEGESEGRSQSSEEVKRAIAEIGINKCARESGFDRKNFIRKLIRGIPVKRTSYREFLRWLSCKKPLVQISSHGIN